MKNHITKGSVFYELFGKEEAADLELRSQLLIAIGEFAKKSELTQADLAEMLGVSQARVSNLLSRKIDKFSVSMLIKFTMRIGLHIKIVVQTQSPKKDSPSAKTASGTPTARKKAKSA